MFSRDQYDAARTSAVIVDRSAQGKIAFAGSDRGSFLHALLTNDIIGLTPGTGVYAAYLTPQGRMISDMRVIEIGDRMLLDVEAAVAGPLAERFDKLIFSEDVQVRDVSHELAEIGVHGPSASDVIERALGMTAKGLVKQYNNMLKERWGPTPSEGPIIIVRDDSLGLTGFDIYVPRKDAGTTRQCLTGASAVEIDKDTTEVLRLEAGRPRFGVDMDADTIPLEAGIEDRAISFTKGCYVGQEVIIRVLHRGHGRVARRLVGLVIGGDAPAPGDMIAAGEHAVGTITSAAQSPLMGSPIALGYVHRDYTAPGTELTVRPIRSAAAVSARVHQIPFSR
jgi:folate-binding protein YgfZ